MCRCHLHPNSTSHNLPRPTFLSVLFSRFSDEAIWTWRRFDVVVSLADMVIAGEVLFADVLLLPNGMSKVGRRQR
jgi:hypothetical protein